ncbi:hypothetical protein L3Q82_005969 [Scortum barcoo]|uniref:Uncharacterized protein n=1 Tax=Scortum barcoo TaxID=214431 RepID=A0ACB8X2Y1_9TELE|nr:hypothetical protein L3Q82_005969 [Scortum barcoo]
MKEGLLHVGPGLKTSKGRRPGGSRSDVEPPRPAPFDVKDERLHCELLSPSLRLSPETFQPAQICHLILRTVCDDVRRIFNIFEPLRGRLAALRFLYEAFSPCWGPPVQPTLFVLSPLYPEGLPVDKLGDEVCLAAGSSLKDGEMVANVKDDKITMTTSKPVMSQTEKIYFSAGFSNETIYSCELNGTSANNENCMKTATCFLQPENDGLAQQPAASQELVGFQTSRRLWDTEDQTKTLVYMFSGLWTG